MQIIYCLLIVSNIYILWKINQTKIFNFQITDLDERSVLMRDLNEFLDNIYLKASFPWYHTWNCDCCFISLKFGNEYYRQICGVPQGSQISAFLCGIYFLHIKKKQLIDFGTNDCNIFHQYVDDVLFISNSRKTAESFLARLLKSITLVAVGTVDWWCFFSFSISEIWTGNEQRENNLLLAATRFVIASSWCKWSIYSSSLSGDGRLIKQLIIHLWSRDISISGNYGRFLLVGSLSLEWLPRGNFLGLGVWFIGGVRDVWSIQNWIQ